MRVLTQFSGFYTPTCLSHGRKSIFLWVYITGLRALCRYNLTAQQIHTLVDFNVGLKVNEVPLQVLNPGIIAAFTCVGVQ